MKAGGSYSYRYADLADILNAVIPVLSKNGLSLNQMTHMGDGGVLMLDTMLMHSSGEWIGGSYPLRSHDRPQEMGSEITYARRYNAAAILGIQADEDDDGAVAQKANPIKKIRQEAAVVEENPGELVATFGKFKGQKIKDVDIYDLSNYVTYIESQAKEAGKPIQGQVAAFMFSANKYLDSRTSKNDSIMDDLSEGEGA
jgi:hypothetical protein